MKKIAKSGKSGCGGLRLFEIKKLESHLELFYIFLHESLRILTQADCKKRNQTIIFACHVTW